MVSARRPDTMRPADVAEAAEAVVAARRAGAPVVLRGRGTRAGWLPAAPPAAVVIDTSGLSGTGRLRPENLTATFPGGTRLADVHRRLSEEGYWLPLEDLEGSSTLGGALAAGPVNPLRATFGLPRDWVLGLTVIDPAGRRLQLGGELVKNVAGYDLTHLHLGSWGRLGLLAEVTVRLLPRPPAEVCLSAVFESPPPAEAAVADVLRAGQQPAALEVRVGPERVTLKARFLGEEATIGRRCQEMADSLSSAGGLLAEPSWDTGADPSSSGRAEWAAFRDRWQGRCRLSLQPPGFAQLARVAADRLGADAWGILGQASAGVYRLFWDAAEPPGKVLGDVSFALGPAAFVVAEGGAAALLSQATEDQGDGWVSFPPRRARSQDALEARVLAGMAGGPLFNPHLRTPGRPEVGPSPTNAGGPS